MQFGRNSVHEYKPHDAGGIAPPTKPRHVAAMNDVAAGTGRHKAAGTDRGNSSQGGPWPTALKVAVFGAGAVGGCLGVHLARSGVQTTLIARGPHLAAMRKNGVTVRTKKRELHAHPFCTDDPAEAGPHDYVIVTVRPHQAAQAAEAMQPLLGPGTIVVTAYDGVPWWYFYRLGGGFDGRRLESVDPDGKQWREIGPERSVGCVVHMTVEVEKPGVIRHRSGNHFVLGEPSGEETKRVETLSRILTEADLKASVAPSIRDEIWLRLWGGIGLDPVSVLTLGTAAKIADDPSVRALAEALMAEAEQVGKALGVRFGTSLEKQFKKLTAAVGDGRAPMLGDLLAGRPLQIDAVGTAVQEMAMMAGVDTPTLDLAFGLVRRRAEDARLYVPPARGNALGQALGAVGGSARLAVQKTAEAGSAVAGGVAAAAGGVASAAGKAAGVATDVFEEIRDAGAWAYGRAAPLGRGAAKAASTVIGFIHETGQGVLATALTRDINAMLAQLVKGAPTAYDRAMDAEYIKTGIGGGLHRIFDGGHTIWGAFKAARDASTDDGIMARAMGMLLGLFRDVTTPAGLPFFTWDPETYRRVSTYLKETFGLPKRVFADLVTYDATDIISGLLGSATLVFRWSDGEAKDFARIVASSGLSAVVKRNPILAVVTLAAMAKAFMEARETGSYKECVKTLAEGTVTAGVPMAVVPVVVAAGGPASVALVASILAGMTVTVLAKKVGEAGIVEELAGRVAEMASAAATEMKERIGRSDSEPIGSLIESPG